MKSTLLFPLLAALGCVSADVSDDVIIDRDDCPFSVPMRNHAIPSEPLLTLSDVSLQDCKDVCRNHDENSRFLCNSIDYSPEQDQCSLHEAVRGNSTLPAIRGVDHYEIDCLGLMQDVCRMPIDEGKGDKAEIRYGYDVSKDKCKLFYYRGIAGNDNNFSTKKKCKIECMNVYMAEFCKEDLDVGSGDEELQRYYYDYGTNQCQKFVYRGTGGNRNNFEDRAACIWACKLSDKTY